uniref:Dimethylargininase n=1 Tax=Daphnia galeata TaxID=27404 RepID=A0A8J2WD11_9CRUS|nr:unnamed protein product [Daphnia galeata]
MANAFKFTHAIVCRLPDSFQKNSSATSDFNLSLAKEQHAAYVSTLRRLGLDVIELPPDEALPDCVFVEDTAVVVNGTALITRPGLPSRQKESIIMKAIIQKELGLPTVEISDQKATIDGGDVLFTGKEFFVGISERTNLGGARAVAAAFPEFPCTPVKINGALHLKNLVTMAGPDIICASKTKDSEEVLKRMEREATFQYQILRVPDRDAANCLFINGTLIHRTSDEFNESTKVFNELACETLELDISEIAKIAKVQTALTCCSILIRKPKHIKSL